MRALLFFLTVVAVVYSQPPPPRRCYETPSQWWGDFFMVDYDEKISRRGHIYYDRINTSIHSAVEYFHSGTTRPDFVRTWLFYSEKAEFIVDERTGGHCERHQMAGAEFPTFGPPSQAQYIHQDKLGGNTGLTVDYFRLEIGGGIYHGMFAPLSSTSQSVCIPVIESFENYEPPLPQARNTHYTYVNITGEAFPSGIFVLPPDCPRNSQL